MIRSFRLTALALLLASPTMPGAIQTAAFAQANPAPGAQTPPAATPPAATPPMVPQMAPAPQPVLWRTDAVEELLRYIQGVGAEGLDPVTYAPERLSAALAGGDPAVLNSVASQTFLRLTADLSGGFVRGDGRVD